MSAVKLEISRVGRVGSVCLESEDVQAVDSCRDGANAIMLSVRYRREYVTDDSDAFKWSGSQNDLHLILTERQVREAVEQLRTAQKAFCTGAGSDHCYDYGKADRAPGGCLRCLMLEACARARQGDHRKVKPAPVERPRFGAITGVWLLLLALWFVCWMWATTGEDLQKELATARQELDGCRQSEAKRRAGGL